MDYDKFTQPPKEHKKLEFEYNQITPTIYLGTNLCCRSHFDEELVSKGVTADISLEEDRVDTPFGVKTFLWLPTKDDNPPTPCQLRIGVDAIKHLVEGEQGVYVHCRHGHGRGPTLVAAYLISTGKSVEEALTLIKEKRPSMHLVEAQIKGLEKFYSERPL